MTTLDPYLSPPEPEWPEPKETVHFVKKDEYWVFRWMAWFLHVTGLLHKKDFFERFWTTFDHTIGVRTSLDISKRGWQKGHERTIKHEKIHIWRKEKVGSFLYSTLYVGPSVTVWLPLSVISGSASMFMDYPHWIVGWVPVILMVLCLPLTFGLAWGRFFIEREAYLTRVWAAHEYQPGSTRLTVKGPKGRRHAIQNIANSLVNNYAWTWPKSWIISWFEKECDRRGWKVWPEELT